MHKSRQQYIVQLGIVALIILALNVLGAFVYKTWDLTEERRFTLTKPTTEMLGTVSDVIYVRILLDGEFPAGFKRLQTATREILSEFRELSGGNLEYAFENPNQGTPEEINAVREELSKDGIFPTNLRLRDASESKEQLIYPYAIFHYGQAMYPVNLLEAEQPGAGPERVLNNSVSLLEYKFANAIQKLRRTRQAKIVFTEGNGELEKKQTAYLETELRRFYSTARMNLDSIYSIPEEIDLVIIAKPQTAFSQKNIFLLDQYVMRGGNLMLLIDPLFVNLDSINQSGTFLPRPRELNLDPLLFKYGARVQPDLILDYECTRIPMVVGQAGGRVQTDLFPWYYHPLVASKSEHPITKNIDRVNLMFPGTIDTIRTAAGISKTIVLKSSEYSRKQMMPVRLSFEMLRQPADPKDFNQGSQNVAVLLEGRFNSLFENRLNAEQEALLQQINTEFLAGGRSAKIMIASDGDLARNLYNVKTNETQELGYNKFENYTFKGNQDFILNTIEYMLDAEGVLAARSKEVKLRLLDTAKARSEALKWQLLNIVLPLLLLIAGGIIYQWIRRKKYVK